MGFRDANGTLHSHAVRWKQNGKITDLNGLLKATDARAWGINECGEIVAIVGENIENGKAFLISNGSASNLFDLIDDVNWGVPNNAYDINDYGQIVGYGDFRGKAAAFLLTPLK